MCKERRKENLERFVETGPRVGREEKEWKASGGNVGAAASADEWVQLEKAPHADPDIATEQQEP